MTKNIAEIIGNRKFHEPPEIAIIKDYVYKNFESEIKVAISGRKIVLIASSSALAGALRLRTSELRKICGDTKQLVIRTG